MRRRILSLAHADVLTSIARELIDNEPRLQISIRHAAHNFTIEGRFNIVYHTLYTSIFFVFAILGTEPARTKQAKKGADCTPLIKLLIVKFIK